jgi:hypothetical protein
MGRLDARIGQKMAQTLFQNVSLSLWERVGVRAHLRENKNPSPCPLPGERGFETTSPPSQAS